MVAVVMRGSGSRKETWRIVVKSRVSARWARVFISPTEKLVRRLSPRVLARLSKSLTER